MSKIVMLVVVLLIYTIVGAAEVIHNFEKERYSRFGFWVILAMCMAMCMIWSVTRLILIS